MHRTTGQLCPPNLRSKPELAALLEQVEVDEAVACS